MIYSIIRPKTPLEYTLGFRVQGLGFLCYNYSKEPQNSIGDNFGPYFIGAWNRPSAPGPGTREKSWRRSRASSSEANCSCCTI